MESKEIPTIKILPFEEIRIIKEIIIVSDRGQYDTSLGSIVYERSFSPDYKLAEIPEEKRDFMYYVTYPKDEYFPNDDVDGIILQSIQNSNKKSFVKNYLYVSTVDKERLENLKNRDVEKTTITFSPLIFSSDYQSLMQVQMNFLRKKINIYRDSQNQETSNLAFFANFNLDQKAILDRIDEVIFH